MNKEERRKLFKQRHPEHPTFEKQPKKFGNLLFLVKSRGKKWVMKNHPEKYQEYLINK